MSSHKAHPRPKPRGEREKAKPPVQQSAPPRTASAHGPGTAPHHAGTPPIPSADPMPQAVPAVLDALPPAPAPPTNGGTRPTRSKATSGPIANGHAPRPREAEPMHAEVAPPIPSAPPSATPQNIPAPRVTQPPTLPPTESAPSAPPASPARPPAANGDPFGPKHVTQRTPTPPSELSEMFATLRDLFVHDRANAARPDAARCGICYLTFPREQLVYREAEGYYACPECLAGMNGTHLPMLRRQRK